MNKTYRKLVFKIVICVTPHINGNRFLNNEICVRFITDVINITNTIVKWDYLSLSKHRKMNDRQANNCIGKAGITLAINLVHVFN